MKKFIVPLMFFAVGLIAGAQEGAEAAGAEAAGAALIAVPVGSWPEYGAVTELRVVHDLQGGAYVPYIAGGRFRIIRTGVGGGQLGRYLPEGFDDRRLSARKLGVSKGGPEQYAAFIGRQGNSEAVYLFGLSFWDELRYYPLEETRAAAIADYAMVPGADGGVMIYTLAEGRLQCLSMGMRGDMPRILREISPRDETVEAFEIRREHWAQGLSYGWYRAARKEGWEISLFSIDEWGNLRAEKNGPYSELPRIEDRVSLAGTPVFTITAGRSVSVYHVDGGGFFRDLHFEAPHGVGLYVTALQSEESSGLLAGEADGLEIVYGVSHEKSGAPALKALFSRPSGDIRGTFFTGGNGLSLVYRDGQALRAALIRMDGGVAADAPLPMPPNAALTSSSARFLRDNLDASRFYLASGGKDTARLFHFGLAGERWELLREMPIPGTVPTEIHSLGSLGKGRETLLLVFPGAIVLCQTGSPGYQSIEAQTYARSIRLNGVVYLAAGSENGICLYRIEE
jgi:hypothetical protein